MRWKFCFGEIDEFCFGEMWMQKAQKEAARSGVSGRRLSER